MFGGLDRLVNAPQGPQIDSLVVGNNSSTVSQTVGSQALILFSEIAIPTFPMPVSSQYGGKYG